MQNYKADTPYELETKIFQFWNEVFSLLNHDKDTQQLAVFTDKTEITDILLSHTHAFIKEERGGQDWSNDGEKLIFWKNPKGNFKLQKKENGYYDVFFGLDFKVSLIKRNIRFLFELKILYLLLTNEPLK